ncbi:hypothetical protein CKO11_13025 [Rhodobacter sp. TJ_12]|nr:hypothetical protein [Rhodobacter sp. TJ_12]
MKEMAHARKRPFAVVHRWMEILRSQPILPTLAEFNLWMPATVSVCIAAQDDLLRGLYDPCGQRKAEHRSLIARLYRKTSHGKTWLAPDFKIS